MKKIVDARDVQARAALPRLAHQPEAKQAACRRRTASPAWVQIRPEATSSPSTTDRYKLTTPRNGECSKLGARRRATSSTSRRSQPTARLEQGFDAEDGQRVNVYTLSPDGNTLTLDVTVTSPKLEQPR